MSIRARFIVLLFAIAVLFSACVNLEKAGQQFADDDFSLQAMFSENGRYIVVHSSGELSSRTKAGIEKAGGTIKESFPEIGVTVVTSDSPEFARLAGKTPGVSFVGPDLFVTLESPESGLLVEADIDDLISENGITDNDLYVAYQWDIKRVGGDAATWDIEKGDGAVVAVLDTGVYAAHPDIAPNYAYGKNFTDITVTLPEGWILWDGGGAQDYEGHGTHVAGTIAASIESGRIIGVAPEAGIANYKVMIAVLIPQGPGSYRATGIGYQSWIINGIVQAAEDGVDVMNLSLGGWLYMNEPGGAAAYVAYLRATQYARQKGVLVVSSSGNGGVDLSKVRPAFSVPSGTPAALSVNATGPDDSLAFYSNYGASETLVVAPGGDISNPPFSYCLSAYSPLNAWAPGAGWVFTIGTSMAAPKVSGVAALLYAQNPGISVSQVKNILAQTAEPLVKKGFDSKLGHGLVHAYRALTYQKK